MAKKAKKNEVAKKSKTELSTNVANFDEDAGKGFEEADKDAFAIPFVRILQSNSPQCKKSDGAFIKGSEEGDIFNTATEEILEELNVIPCHYRRAFIEWIPVDEGGGFIAEHTVAAGKELEATLEEPDKNGKRFLPNGHELVDTRMHYCLNAETADPMVICMASTQLKKSRNWMTVMQSTKSERGDGTKFTPPMFSQVFEMTTVPESNEKGSWFGWKVTKDGFVEDAELYQAAKNFRNLVVDGSAVVKHEQEGAASGDTPEEEF